MALLPSIPGPGSLRVLSDDVLDAMRQRAQEKANQQRRQDAEHRLEWWDECFTEQLRHAARKQYSDPEAYRGTAGQLSVALNPPKDLTKAVAQAYTRGVCRYLRDATEDEEKAWDELLAEDGIAHQAILWNRLAFLLGPIHVVPVVKEGRLVREVLLPHQTDVMTAPGDPLGPPIAVRWTLFDGTHQGQDDDRVAEIVLDQHSWQYFNAKGKPVKGPDGLEVVEHGLVDHRNKPLCPAVTFRLDDPRDPDWWSGSVNDRLFAVGRQAGVKYARWLWIRGWADSKRMMVRAENQKLFPEGQSFSDPSDALEIFGSQAQSDIEVLDLETNPEKFMSELNWMIGQLGVSFGLPPGTLTYQLASSSEPVATIRVSNETRQALVAEQKPFLAPAERRLAMVTMAVARKARHPLWGELPPQDEVFERAVTEYPQHPSTMEPKEQREQDKQDLKWGLISLVDLAKRRDPTATRRQLLEGIKRNVEENNNVRELLARNQQAADPELGPPTQDEQNGEMGGRPPNRNQPSETPDGAE